MTLHTIMLVENGDARWSARLASGPLPVTWADITMPTKPSMARRAFLISLTWAVLRSDLPKPSGSKMPPCREEGWRGTEGLSQEARGGGSSAAGIWV